MYCHCGNPPYSHCTTVAEAQRHADRRAALEYLDAQAQTSEVVDRELVDMEIDIIGNENESIAQHEAIDALGAQVVVGDAAESFIDNLRSAGDQEPVLLNPAAAMTGVHVTPSAHSAETNHQLQHLGCDQSLSIPAAAGCHGTGTANAQLQHMLTLEHTEVTQIFDPVADCDQLYAFDEHDPAAGYISEDDAYEISSNSDQSSIDSIDEDARVLDIAYADSEDIPEAAGSDSTVSATGFDEVEVCIPINCLKLIAHNTLSLETQLYDSICLLQWKYASVTADFWYKVLLRMRITRSNVLSADCVRRRAKKLTPDIMPVSIDCCVNSCMAFVKGPAENTLELDSCKYCGEMRYEWYGTSTGRRRRSRKTFLYNPLIPRLQVQYANKTRAATLQNYPLSLTTSPRPANDHALQDFWDGSHYATLKDKGLFDDNRTVAFQFSTDGVSLVRQKNFSLWPIILINYNLPPAERVKTRNIILLGFVPGPTHPKDIDSFLAPLVNKMLSLRHGVKSYNASKSEEFVLKAHITTVTGDFPAIAMLMNMKGPNGKYPCRYCTICGVFCTKSKHYYYPHTCDIKSYENDLARKDMVNNMHLVAAANRKELQRETGHSGLSIFLKLDHSIYFPDSFALDPMHLISNVTALMFSHWNVGSSMPKPGSNDNKEGPESTYVLSKNTVTSLGNNMKSSRAFVPTAIA